MANEFSYSEFNADETESLCVWAVGYYLFFTKEMPLTVMPNPHDNILLLMGTLKNKLR